MRQSILRFLLLLAGGCHPLSVSALSVPLHLSMNLQPLSTSSLSFSRTSNAFVIQKVVRSPTSFSKSALFSATASSSVGSTGSTFPEGLIKTVSKPGYGPLVQLGDIATIKYACYVADQSKAFARSAAQKMAVGDGTMIPGWDAAVRSMRVGERSVVRIENADLAYGATGVYPVIPPNAILELDLEILDSAPAAANIDFDALAEADATPRTAADISAAYQERQAAKAAEGTEELEGLEAFLAKAKNFYFYGLFEGETGERPPWFLRPSITFPLAILIVGAAFYISYVSGAITERGAQTTDELDQIIISSSNINAMWTTALMTIKVGPLDF